MTYPEIERLAQAIRAKGLTFAVEPAEARLKGIFYRHVSVQATGLSCRVPVEDEEQDMDTANPVLLLDRILRECHWYETSEDYLVWAKDLGLDASFEPVRQIYFDLREITPKIRALVGPEVRSIPDHDVEFNTGMMQALRAYTIDDA